MPIVHVSHGNGHGNDRSNGQLPDDDERNVDNSKHAAIVEAGDETTESRKQMVAIHRSYQRRQQSDLVSAYLCISDSEKTSLSLIKYNMLPSSKAIKTDNVILDRLYPGLLQYILRARFIINESRRYHG
jgi:hypothetical protein